MADRQAGPEQCDHADHGADGKPDSDHHLEQP
jgi:hypothetical protein